MGGLIMHVKMLIFVVEPAEVEAVGWRLQHRMAPALVEQPGALSGTWMANTVTGWMVSVTCWRDRAALETARAPLGALRAGLLDDVDGRLFGSTTYVHDEIGPSTLPAHSVGRCCRVVWTESRPGDPRAREAVLADAARSMSRYP